MNESTKESVRFYTGADFLIINALLWRNKEALDKCIEIVHKNNHGVIQEALKMTPEVRFGVSAEEAHKIFEAYKRRTPETINEDTKKQIIATAIEDIHNICNSMQPANKSMFLFRNVNENFAIKKPKIGETVDLLGITSTSTTGQEIDYGKNNFKKTSYQYKIEVPIGTPILVIENDYRKENEAILPPMKYRVLDIDMSGDKITVELVPVMLLDIDSLIESAISICLENR